MLTEQARSIGSFALRHYEKATQLDSVTVLYHEAVRPGLWHIRHQRRFAVEDLRNTAVRQMHKSRDRKGL
jgi:hypothetical protein